MAVLEMCAFKPSGRESPIWRWGVSVSMRSRKPMPSKIPMAAGSTRSRPMSADISIAGMISDHMEAATITPEAKPKRNFCRRGDISSFMKNTNAAPSIVPRKGINKVRMTPDMQQR